MDRAVAFYEDILGTKAKHRENDRWADFDMGKGCYFGLIGKEVLDKKIVYGNNAVIVFKTDDVDATLKKIQRHNVKINYLPTTLDFTDYFYCCFECEDTEGNILEIAQYDR